MPPRVVKRGGAAGSRRGRGRGKPPNPQPEVHEGVVKAEDVSDAVVEVRDDDEPVEEIKVEDKPVVVDKPEVVAEQVEVKLDDHGADTIEDKGDEAKESVDEYGRDERLDLDDNEPEYEGEEYVGVDYDEKEMETEEGGDEIEEEPEEEHDIEEKGVDGSDDEDVPEGEGEGDDDDEQAPGEEIEHADAAEHEERQKIVQERRKRKEFEVFVGGLDKDATDSDIRKVFSQVGEIVEVRLMMNTQTKKNKGFAFLRFSTVEQAKRAVTELKNPVINGKKCGVTPSQDSDTLFLGNICKTWTKEALKERLKHYGVDNIDDITLVEDTNKEGMNRGFAFLEFSSRSDAMDAFKRLQRRDVLFGVERPAKVSFADSFIDPGDEIMAQVATIFIDCLPPSWDEDCVRELLKKYGQIEKVELARNMPSAGRKDYGFVTFDTHDAAVTCAKSINNTELGEGENKAKVRARLSRPHQKGRSKHSSRDSFRSGRASGRSARSSFGRPAPHGLPRPVRRAMGSRVPPVSMKRHALSRGRRPAAPVPSRPRPLPLPPRSYDRRAPGAVPPYPRSSLKREYSRRDELPPRSRAAIDYSSRVVLDRRPPHRDEYVSRSSAYSDYSRGASRGDLRRPFVEDGYSSRFERPSPSYRDGRGRDYDAIESKRPFSALDDVPPRYVEPGVRHSRARIDYEPIPAAPHYGDAYSDRFARSNMGYSGSRSSVSGHDTHGLYSGRQPMSYSGGSYSSTDAAGAYSSSGYSSDYMPRGSDVGGSSYSSLYQGRGAGGSSYMGSGSGSYY